MTSTPAPAGSAPEAAGDRRPLAVLLYSDDADVRAAVRLAVGRRPAADLPVVEWTECATEAAVLSAVDAGGLDVLVLDGEAVPAGGMGMCKQLKDEIYECPPVLVLIGRPQDAWLATWSHADLAVPHPLDPVAVAEAVAELARRRIGSRAS
jgi:DNA-binding response OmpR family regulator